MVKPIMRDIFFLNQPSEPATEADRKTGMDLLDTLKAHEEECVGMAANMIGVRKNIIAVHMGFMNVLMYNPKIIKRSGAYETEEGCLSLAGVRKCMRIRRLKCNTRILISNNSDRCIPAGSRRSYNMK